MSTRRITLRVAALTAFAAVGMVVVGGAEAGTATSNLNVTATVSANCTVTTNAVAFGAYDPVSANASSALNGTGAVIVTCTSGSLAAIALGQGANAAAGSTDVDPARRMKDATTNYLSYELFTDAARTLEWGNTPLTDVDHIGTGTQTSITVYGRVPAAQNVPAGSYTDTVVATVTF